MTKGPPWMPLNVADYLKDTSHLVAHEHGAYVLLIMRYWQDGGLPSDEILIRRYSLLSAEQWIESRPVLAALFDEGWKHKRIDAELAKAADIIEKRRSAAEQKHGKRSANAEHVDSTSSDTRVPPSPEPKPNNPPSSVPDAAEARDLFGDVWEAFPQNPSSSESKAIKAWERIKPPERAAVLAASIRYAKWFGQDCEARERTVEAGLSYVPHLATWLDGGQWREAAKLPIKGEVDPDTAARIASQVKVHHEDPVFIEAGRMRGKRYPTDKDGYWNLPIEIVDQARANLAKPEVTH